MSDFAAPTDPADDQRRRQSRLLGLILMAGGGLIALLCGTCTLAFVGNPSGAGSVGDFYGAIALIVGGVPTALGLAGFVAGVALYRRGGPPWAKDDPRWVERRRRQWIAIAAPVFTTAAIFALWNFGGQILFAAAGFAIARWMFLRAEAIEGERVRGAYWAGGGLLTAVAVLGLWLRDADMLFEPAGVAIALWVYRGGGRAWFRRT